MNNYPTASSASLRLGFHYHIPAYRDSDGRVKTAGYLGVFLDSLAECCRSLTCFLHSPLEHQIAHMDYALQAPNFTWVDVGPHLAVHKRILTGRKRVTSAVIAHRDQLDALLIRGPSPFLPLLASKAGVPVALLLVGDLVAAVSSSKHTGWRRQLIRLYSHWNTSHQLRAARHTLTFVNSHKLYDTLRPEVSQLQLIQTTTLSETDLYIRDDTCTTTPVQLLYAGRLNRAKGLFAIVESVGALVQQGHDVVLNLVGWSDEGQAFFDELQQVAQQHGVQNRVIYHGFKTVGPDLFEQYKAADIFVLASTSDFEGFPRVIWEALAHSVPVVATRVGSIPFYLKDQETAVLIPPCDTAALIRAVQQVITTSALRHHMIQQGLMLARQNTLEKRAVELVTTIEEWLS